MATPRNLVPAGFVFTSPYIADTSVNTLIIWTIRLALRIPRLTSRVRLRVEYSVDCHSEPEVQGKHGYYPWRSSLNDTLLFEKYLQLEVNDWVQWRCGDMLSVKELLNKSLKLKLCKRTMG